MSSEKCRPFCSGLNVLIGEMDASHTASAGNMSNNEYEELTWLNRQNQSVFKWICHVLLKCNKTFEALTVV